MAGKVKQSGVLRPIEQVYIKGVGMVEVKSAYILVAGEPRIWFGQTEPPTAEPLTATEYDTLNLQAQSYDFKNITAEDYDMRGKQLLP